MIISSVAYSACVVKQKSASVYYFLTEGVYDSNGPQWDGPHVVRGHGERNILRYFLGFLLADNENYINSSYLSWIDNSIPDSNLTFFSSTLVDENSGTNGSNYALENLSTALFNKRVNDGSGSSDWYAQPAYQSVTLDASTNLAAGDSLTADTTVIDGLYGAGAASSYQWNRDGVAIGGATSSTYTLTTADEGSVITATVGYTDSQGAAGSVTSAATGVVSSDTTAPVITASKRARI